jgi:hypothetical protein
LKIADKIGALVTEDYWPGNLSPKVGWLGLLALFLIIYGAKSTFIAAVGSPLPYSDQWNFEALGLYRPYLSGTLDWAEIVAPYNEHRMAFSRLLLLGIFEIADGWDPILAMLFNSLIHTGFALAFTAFMVRLSPRSFRLPLMAFICLCFVLPLGFENTLMGMNAHFYLLLVFSLPGLILLTTSPGVTWRWTSGLALAVCAEFTLASGALTAITAAFIVAIQLATGVRERRPNEFIALALLLLPGVVGMLSVPPSPDNVRSHDLWEFVAAVTAVSALPLVTIAGVVFVHAPIAWLSFDICRARPLLKRPAWGLLATIAWIAAQILAIAYSRGEQALAARYFDIVVLLLPINLLALGLWLSRPLNIRGRRWLVAYATIWILLIVVGLGVGGYFSSWRLAVFEKAGFDNSLPAVAASVRTGRTEDLQSISRLVFPDINKLGAILSDPTLAPYLPEEIRNSDSRSSGFSDKTLLKGRFSSFAVLAKLVLGQGPIWLALGTAVIFALCWAKVMNRVPEKTLSSLLSAEPSADRPPL